MFLCTDLPHTFDTRPPGRDWLSAKEVATLLSDLLWVVAIFPLAVAFLALWSGQCVHLRGIKEWVFMFLGSVLTVGLIGLWDIFPISALISMSSSEGSEGHVGVAAFAVLLMVLTLLAICAFNMQQLPGSR